MSRATERRKSGRTLAAWSLMSAQEVADHMGVSVDTAKALETFPWVRVGNLYKADPIDVAIWMLANKAGVSMAEYRERHGEETAAHAGRYLRDVRKAQAEVA